MKTRGINVLPSGWIVLFAVLLSANVNAVPYIGNEFTYYQPDGEAIQVRLYGDEFYAVAETLDGYVVAQDPQTREFRYAALSADGNEHIPTRLRVGKARNGAAQRQIDETKGKLRKNARIHPVSRRAKADAMRRVLGSDQDGRPLSASVQPAAGDGTATATAGVAPAAAIAGARVGLVLLAQFPDRLGDVTINRAQIDDYFNAVPYTGFNNATSVKGYFFIQSNNKLELSNVVTAYFTAAHPRDYYTDPAISYGSRARELIVEGLNTLQSQNFDFTQLDGNGDKVVDGVSCMYAGATVNAWSEGLWPHASSVSWSGFTSKGLNASAAYQITNLGNTLAIGTVCHELGHAVVKLPDLYSYDGNAAEIGSFCLMAGGNWGSSGRHPTSVSAPLKYEAGWATVQDATSSTVQTYTLNVDENAFVRFLNPANSKEYFMAEMRAKSGYEGPYGGDSAAVCPSAGLVIYHYMATGSNPRSSIFTSDNPNCNYSTPYRQLLIERNPTTSYTPWYDDPSPGSNDAFVNGNTVTSATRPELKFWSASGRTVESGANINSISVSTASLSFRMGQIGNSAPVANAQSVTTAQGMAKAITLTGGDADGNPLTFAIVTQPAHGTLSGTVPNVTYTPVANYNGSDSFTFKVNDGTVDSAVATVSVSVLPLRIPENPTSTQPGLDWEQYLGSWSAMPNFDTLTKSASGTSSVIGLGLGEPADNFAYRFNGYINAPADGVYTFYTSSDDGSQLYIGTSQVVNNDGLHPTEEKSGNIGLKAGKHALTVTFFEKDGGQALVASWAGPGLTKQTIPASVLLRYAPPSNQVPVANAQSVTTAEDTAKAVTLTGSDPDGDALTYLIVTQPAHGTLGGAAPNVTYTPAANYNGSDSFTFNVTDSKGAVSGNATVSITVTAVNNAPVANAQSATTSEDTTTAIALTGSDADGDPLTYAIATPPAHGTLSGTAPNVTYTPVANYNGADAFTFKVNDGSFDSAPAPVSITVTAVNDAPVANAQSATTPAGTAKAIVLTGSDADGGPLVYAVVTPPAHGTLSGTAPNVTYTPAANYAGDDAFTFKVNDGTADSATATVSITVTAMMVNVVFPANGGVLQSFTSEYGSGYLAADLTDGITTDDGWSSKANPGAQEFVYSFLNGQSATLNQAVIHSGTGEGLYFSKGIEVWTSADGSAYSLAASGTLANGVNALTLDLGGRTAKRVKLRVVSGYRTDYWELGEFVVNGMLMASTLPSPWQARDIGTVGLAGDATFAISTFTVKGAGSAIGGSADSFHFVNQVSSGDCQITLRVASLANAATAGKAGVMIRESLNANAREAGVWVTPGSGILFTYRTSTGGSTTTKASTGKVAPYWVRLNRTGNTFTAYFSSNGTTWTKLDKAVTVGMGAGAYMGVGVCSGSKTKLANGTIDSVTAVP